MAKQILLLSASPRRGGNSDTLCDEFARGAKDAGHCPEKVFVREHKINYCTGCGSCNTSHQCVQQDDMGAILQKMVAADVIVLATPVYFYTMDAQLKTVIDRTVPRYREIAGKDFYFIVTAADPDQTMLELTVAGLRGFTEECLPDPREKGILYAAGVWEKSDILGHPALKEAYEMGKNV